MTCYAFANCALFSIPIERDSMYKGKSVSNMRTEGILRLLKGQSFALHPDDREILFATPQWQKLKKQHEETEPNLVLEDFYHYELIAPTADDVFLWTPFADCLCTYTAARCEDGSPYPSMFWPISDVFKHMQRIPFEQVTETWHQLIYKLSHMKRKGIVLYPPDLLLELEPDTPHRENLLRHVRLYNKDAASLFGVHGWKVFTPDAEVDTRNPHWSHYSWQSRNKMWKEIESELF